MTHQGQDPYGGGAPPPGQQPGYGQQPPLAGQQPVAGQPAPVVEGLQPPIANLISYLLGWLGGLIMYLTQRNPEVRFHGIQSIGLSVAVIAGYIILTILAFVGATLNSGLIVLIIGLVQLVFFIAAFVLVIYMAVQGYNQKHVKLPVIGDLAERYAAPAAV